MKPRLNQRLQFSLAYLLVAATVLLVLQAWLQAPRTVEIPMSRFLDLVRTDKIEKVALTERQIQGIAKPDALPTGPSGAGDRLRQWLTQSAEVRVFTVTRIPGVEEAPLVAELEKTSHYRARRAAIREHHLERQEKARKLAAGGDLHERARPRPWIGLHPELHAIDAVRPARIRLDAG